MLEKYVRAFYQMILVDPLARFSLKLYPLSPNAITFTGCFLGLGAALCLALGSTWWALSLLLLSGFLDTLDGTIARMAKRESALGTVYDIVCDRLVEMAIVVALFLYAPEGRALISLLMMGSILMCVSTFLVVGIFSENGSQKGFHYSPGLVERGEAFVFFALMILFPSQFVLLGSLFAILVFLTGVIRIVQFANIFHAQ